jgi:hypothetical protein
MSRIRVKSITDTPNCAATRRSQLRNSHKNVGILTRRWEDNIKMDLKGIMSENVELIRLFQDGVKEFLSAGGLSASKEEVYSMEIAILIKPANFFLKWCKVVIFFTNSVLFLKRRKGSYVWRMINLFMITSPSEV